MTPKPERAASADGAQLVARAEQILAERGVDRERAIPSDVRALLHDLSVHQIELEIQNEELRDAQRAITRARDEYAWLYNQAPVGYATLDERGVVRRANETLAQMLGVDLGSLLGHGFADLLSDTEREVFLARFKAFFKQPAGKSIDASLRRRDGAALRVRLTGSRALSTTHDSDPSLLVIVHDVTEAYRATRSLEGEKELLRVTLQSIGDGVVATDTAGRVTLMNPVAESLTGWTLDEARGAALSRVFRILHEHTREPCRSPVDQVLATGATVALERHTVLVARDGRERIVADSAAPIRDEGGEVVGVVLVFRDATEELHVQSELQRMAKLDSLGVMAGGIAHDFNNLLTAMAGNIGYVRDSITARAYERAMACLADADAAATRARDLARQLLTFAKGGAPVRRAAALRGIVDEAVALALTGSRCRCHVTADEGLWPAHVDAGQVSQVLHNLLLNAVQAMPQGGDISVTLSNEEVSDASGTLLAPGHYVRAVVRDGGVGIVPEIRDRIFDPFFTTKSRGSGLGLASAWSIVRNHDGYISVESAPGEGSSFSVYLPAAPTAKLAAPTSGAEAEKSAGWRVLVLEDEPLVARIAHRILSGQGHQVTTVDNGPAAISEWRRAKESDRAFDLAILDLTIPGGVGGKEVVAELRRDSPALCAVATSGYHADPVMANYREYGFAACLPKPYGLTDLRALVADLQSAVPRSR